MHSLPVFLFLFLLSAGSSADIYSWKDEKGRVHFSDQNPDNNTSTLLQVDPVNTTPSNTETTQPVFTVAPQGGITLIPLSIRRGIAGKRADKNPDAVYDIDDYQVLKKQAKKAGINLGDVLDKNRVAGFDKKTGMAFSLFYNMAEAKSCQRDYLLQRVRLTKSFSGVGLTQKNSRDANGESIETPMRVETIYLVEAIRLDEQKRFFVADKHHRNYPLAGASKRELVADIEIGCGTIDKVLEKRSWPYAEKSRYHLIQHYTTDDTGFNSVDFEFSVQYQFRIAFDNEGNLDVIWPTFL